MFVVGVIVVVAVTALTTIETLFVASSPSLSLTFAVHVNVPAFVLENVNVDVLPPVLPFEQLQDIVFLPSPPDTVAVSFVDSFVVIVVFVALTLMVGVESVGGVVVFTTAILNDLLDSLPDSSFAVQFTVVV